MHASSIVSFACLFAIAGVAGHPHPATSNDKTHEPRAMSERELQDRQHAAVKRHVLASNCARQVHEFQEARKRKRSLVKRETISTVPVASVTASAHAPHFTSLQNTTCVTAPEVTEGPYYVNNELVRMNVSESQPGVPLKLDIGVLDVRTCQPITDSSTFVEIWHASANGDYSGFVSSSSTSSRNATSSSALARRQAASATPTGSMPSGAMPSGIPSGGGGGMSTGMTDQQTFHRGSWPVSSTGIVEFDTKFPGYYQGRTIHIHTMIHQNATIFANGTLFSQGGSVRHVGQIFFDDATTESVLAVAPYNVDRGFNRTTNSQDSIFAQENADGNNAFVDISMLGSSVEDGLLGYITIGVDTQFTGSITSTNYASGSLTASYGSAEVTGSPGSGSQATSKANKLSLRLW